MSHHLIQAQQLTVPGMTRIFDLADKMHATFQHPNERKMMRTWLAGTLMHAVFYEASTRTRFSFETGAHHLGMDVVSTENAAQFSSAIKGETLEDSIRTYASYSPDVIVLRHPEDGAAERARRIVDTHGYHCHIINAGDGRHQHPTQALLDIYTIDRRFGSVNGLTVVIGGDLANGRTVRSLSYLLGKYEGVRIIFVAPKPLRIGADILAYLDRHKIKYDQTELLEKVLPEADVLYWTRLQEERITNRKLAQKMHELQQTTFSIRGGHLGLLKPGAIIMHPFPRHGEISTQVDTDPRAFYFKQIQNGMFIRMALLMTLVRNEQA